MVWRGSLAITLALGSATWASTQLFNARPAVKDKSDNLQLRLEPIDIQMGVPQAFTFVLVNISDHDVRIPSAPSLDCGDNYNGSLWLILKFTSLVHGPSGISRGCSSSGGHWPLLMDRVKGWKVLHSGESLAIEATKDQLQFEDKEAGTYEFWVVYQPPPLSVEEQAQLHQAGIDFPHDELTSTHIAFVKKP